MCVTMGYPWKRYFICLEDTGTKATEIRLERISFEALLCICHQVEHGNLSYIRMVDPDFLEVSKVTEKCVSYFSPSLPYHSFRPLQ